MMYEERKYRNMFKGLNLEFFDVCVYETDLRIGANKNLYKPALEAVRRFRRHIESYIASDPNFADSLKPIKHKPDAPEIIVRMCKASEMAGVGPMAAVAGGISEMVGKELLKYSNDVVVENGGDIFIKTDIPRKVGIYAGSSPLSEKIALGIDPADTPLGICTSSGTVGHSLSFGNADAVVILSKDVFLADAVATAAGNRVKSEKDIEKAIEFASGIEGVLGILIIIGDKMGAWGNIRITEF